MPGGTFRRAFTQSLHSKNGDLCDFLTAQTAMPICDSRI
jgi:hypothetical protein